MVDQRVSNLADILVNYSVEVERGHTVHIGCWPFNPAAIPYLQEVTRSVLDAGGHPLLDLEPEFLGYLLLLGADDDQLGFVDPRAEWMFKNLDRSIVLTCEENTRRLTNTDPQRQAILAGAYKELQEEFYERAAEGSVRWVYTLVPTEGYAQNAEMSLQEFQSYYFRSTYADQDDPITYLQAMGKEQERLAKWFDGKSDVTIRGPNVDLRLSIKGRPFINCSGQENLPDGEIFTGPVEDSAEGWIRFSYPAVEKGREVTGVELKFDKGKVVEASADKNEQFLLAALEVDEGARYIGEFAFGLNYEITQSVKNILFDEKIGGSIHLALGFGYPESGSKNSSAIHWDLITDMKEGGEVVIDDELVYQNGRFLI